MTDNDAVSIQFRWTTYRPDQREYRQQEAELNPSAFVIVKVPKTDEYFHGFDEPTDQPILTLAGMKYVIDQFDTVFLPAKKEASANPDDDWEEEEPRAEKKTDDDWESDTDFDTSTEPDKVPWNDDNGKDWS